MSGFAPFFMWKLAKKAIRTAVLLLFISNETLKLGLAKWQVPEKIIIQFCSILVFQYLKQYGSAFSSVKSVCLKNNQGDWHSGSGLQIEIFIKKKKNIYKRVFGKNQILYIRIMHGFFILENKLNVELKILYFYDFFY